MPAGEDCIHSSNSHIMMCHNTSEYYASHPISYTIMCHDTLSYSPTCHDTHSFTIVCHITPICTIVRNNSSEYYASYTQLHH